MANRNQDDPKTMLRDSLRLRNEMMRKRLFLLVSIVVLFTFAFYALPKLGMDRGQPIEFENRSEKVIAVTFIHSVTGKELKSSDIRVRDFRPGVRRGVTRPRRDSNFPSMYIIKVSMYDSPQTYVASCDTLLAGHTDSKRPIIVFNGNDFAVTKDDL